MHFVLMFLGVIDSKLFNGIFLIVHIMWHWEGCEGWIVKDVEGNGCRLGRTRKTHESP